MSDFYSVTPVKARKPHPCWVCREPIEAGMVYAREAGTADGDVWSHRSHVGCVWLWAAANGVLNEYPWDGLEDPRELIEASEAGIEEEERLLQWGGAGVFGWPSNLSLGQLQDVEQGRVRRLLRQWILEGVEQARRGC